MKILVTRKKASGLHPRASALVERLHAEPVHYREPRALDAGCNQFCTAPTILRAARCS